MDKKKLVLGVAAGTAVASAVAGIVHMKRGTDKSVDLGDAMVSINIGKEDVPDCWEVLAALRKSVEDKNTELTVEDVIVFPEGKIFNCTIDGSHHMVQLSPTGELVFGYHSSNEE